MTECTQTQFAFQAHGSRQVTAQFDGGTMTSDAGGLLLREVDRKMNLLPRFRQVHAVTSSPRAIALLQCRFSVACTMNMAWKRRPHEAGLNSCGPQLIEVG